MWNKILLCMAMLMPCMAQADVIIEGQTIESENIEEVFWQPLSGNMIITSDDDWTITVTQEAISGGGPAAVNINTFTVNDASVLVGANINLSWTVVNGVSCDAQGGTANWASVNPALPNGNQTLTMSTAGSFTFTLQCTGADASVSTKYVGVTVTDEVTPPVIPACDNPSLSGSTVTWASVFGSAFPAPVSAQVLTSIPKAGYLAIQFNTESVADSGGLSTVEHVGTTGSRLGSVSLCPGKFDVLPECDHKWGISGGITWSTANATGSCKLLPNTTYYFNLTFTNGSSASTDSCTQATCSTNVRVSNPN